MPRRVTTTNTFNGVAAGQRATLDLPRDKSLVYHHVYLIYDTGTTGGPTRANMESEINQIRVMINGKPQWTFSAAELFSILENENRSIPDGFIPLLFSDPRQRTPQAEDSLALGTGGINTFQIQVDIDGGATNPSLTARVEGLRIANGPRPTSPMLRYDKRTIPVSSTGTITFTDLPESESYTRLYLFEASNGDINSVKVEVGGDEIYNLDRAVAENQIDMVYDFTPVSALFPVLFDRTNRISDALAVANSVAQGELKITLDMAAANSVDLIAESVGEPF